MLGDELLDVVSRLAEKIAMELLQRTYKSSFLYNESGFCVFWLSPGPPTGRLLESHFYFLSVRLGLCHECKSIKRFDLELRIYEVLSLT